MTPEPKPEPSLVIVSTAERPDLVPVVAGWLWEAFGRKGGRSLEQTLAAVMESATAAAMPRTFVLLADGIPAGTASLTETDLEERPDLTPWLASVVVAPQMRRRGYAARLVAAIEAEARAAGVPTLWLYTSTAERIYARIGWHRVEMVRHGSTDVALMARTLHPRS